MYRLRNPELAYRTRSTSVTSFFFNIFSRALIFFPKLLLTSDGADFTLPTKVAFIFTVVLNFDNLIHVLKPSFAHTHFSNHFFYAGEIQLYPNKV